jgi:two-component system response regulator AtoC
LSDTIVVCDDEERIRGPLCEHLEHEGYRAIPVANGRECLDAVEQHAPAAVLVDLHVRVMDGLTALRALRELDDDLPVIVLTPQGVESAIEATKLGATAYIGKPFDPREATLQLQRALSEHRLRREVHYFRGRERGGYADIVGRSAAMLGLFETLRSVERVDAPTVLIQGESGTGKDLVARAIHARGPRRHAAFTEIDCTALPEHLIESELFGHERGAFTDARTTKRGLFEVASGGVLFLDEIGELPLGMQAKLLRVLDNRKFRRVGGIADIPMNTAVVAATNRRLRDEAKAGRFREDLFFRLYVLPIEVPPLRERADDILELVQYFLERFNKSFGRSVKGTSGEAMEMLCRYAWPGNVRELRNVLERTVILLEDDVIQAADLPPELRFQAPPSDGTPDGACPFVLPEGGVDLEAVDRGLMEQALVRTSGNRSAAAKLLGISRYALRYRMEKVRPVA